MRVVKKINNNVAECLDNKGNSLVAFGRGLGFPKTPYELTDLSKIDMTFYKLNEHFELLLTEIPEDLMLLSVEIVQEAQKKLSGKLNPTLVFSLADHIQFAVRRQNEFKEMRILFSQDIAQLYPAETQLAEEALVRINKALNTELPRSEVTNIAMHFINSQTDFSIDDDSRKIEELIEIITQIIEGQLQICIERDEFNYQRFQAHVRYYLKRLREQEHFIDGNDAILQNLRLSQPAIYQAAVTIMNYIQQTQGFVQSDDELLYLMVHINRLYEKNSESSS
ncbi:PRD domain-containing protein [Streptococcus chenjunshii]|uniref:PRD domain-containing protein n=1 Tax=Streptococcus chenjunshii TaxID=2173853 RepID=A0A372KIS8_9STRE|nr:PRD domain-containing protein [Streptococcus chenjunshii]AXQ79094.1 PRD domain-containing protein [Streptococcus chenjunshii]RFU49989.1 PRD domain-containing protein [Streptococcus chenjunshii]RFU52179.1 PRD domain-containing protein [Streptococcus chenjunshii]